jgi:hypothetical protein
MGLSVAAGYTRVTSRVTTRVVLLRQSLDAVTRVYGSPNEPMRATLSINRRARKFIKAVVNYLEKLWSIQHQHLYNSLMAYSYYGILKIT